MHSRFFVSVVLLALANSATADAAKLPTQMIAVGKWKVDYGYTECTAQRDFTDAEGKAALSIRPSPMGDVAEFVIGRDGRGPTKVEQSWASISAGGKTIRPFMLRYGIGKPTWRKFDIYSAPMSFLDALKADVVLSFRPRASESYDFPLIGIGKVVTALITCNADLRKFWNVGGESDGRFSKLSTTDLRGIFRDGDYPVDAYWSGQEGTGQFLLMVDEAGKFVGCTPITTSKIPVFDVTSCGVIKLRGKATPALDKNGKAVRSTIVTPPITFRMP